MRTILLMMIGVGSLMAGSFSRNVNGVVTDSRTNLEWQDDYSDNGNSIKRATWQNAIDYCENLNLDGKSDWRLPNTNELVSLVDDKKYNPSIDAIFQNTYSTYSHRYWSSTTIVNYSNNAWIVSFYDGYQGDGNYVRCVRAGQ